jgi:hypothetical protein
VHTYALAFHAFLRTFLAAILVPSMLATAAALALLAATLEFAMVTHTLSFAVYAIMFQLLMHAQVCAAAIFARSLELFMLANRRAATIFALSLVSVVLTIELAAILALDPRNAVLLALFDNCQIHCANSNQASHAWSWHCAGLGGAA